MKVIPLKELKVGDKCLFRMSTWSIENMKHVTLKYIGSRYVVMKNSENNEENCAAIDEHHCIVDGRKPIFYVDENNLY